MYDSTLSREDPVENSSDIRNQLYVGISVAEGFIYYSVPMMRLVEYLCNLGGLFSLFLGASVMTLYEYLAIFVRYLSNKERQKRKKKYWKKRLRKRITNLNNNIVSPYESETSLNSSSIKNFNERNALNHKIHRVTLRRHRLSTELPLIYANNSTIRPLRY